MSVFSFAMFYEPFIIINLSQIIICMYVYYGDNNNNEDDHGDYVHKYNGNVSVIKYYNIIAIFSLFHLNVRALMAKSIERQIKLAHSKMMR